MRATESVGSVSRSRAIVWRNALRDSALPSKAKLVGFVLSTYMDRLGLTYRGSRSPRATNPRPDGCSVSLRTVDGALADLELAGFLEIDPPKTQRTVNGRTVFARRGGNAGPNVYLATIPADADELVRREWEAASSSAQPAHPSAAETDSQVRSRCSRKR